MLGYLVQKHALPLASLAEVGDVVDPELERFPEEVFGFYGDYFGQAFGVEQEAIAHSGKIILMPSKSILPGPDTSQYAVLVHKSVPSIPLFLRQGGFVLKVGQLLSRAELDQINPRVNEVNDQNGFDKVYLAKGCDLRDVPKGEVILKI